jgi:hypothetical protein
VESRKGEAGTTSTLKLGGPDVVADATAGAQVQAVRKAQPLQVVHPRVHLDSPRDLLREFPHRDRWGKETDMYVTFH